MKRVLSIWSAVSLISLTVLVSCKKESDEITTQEPLTIEAAKEWFAENIQTPSSSARKPIEVLRDARWDKAKLVIDGKFKMIVVPIVHDSKQQPAMVIAGEDNPSSKKEIKSLNFSGFEERLVIFQKDGKNQALLYEHIPDKAYLKRKNYKVDTYDFTGYVLIRDWTNTLLKAERYENGHLLYQSKPTTTSKPARQQGCSAVSVTYVWEVSCAELRTSYQEQHCYNELTREYVVGCGSDTGGSSVGGSGFGGNNGSGGNGGGGSNSTNDGAGPTSGSVRDGVGSDHYSDWRNLPTYEQYDYLFAYYGDAFNAEETSWLAQNQWMAKYLIPFAEETGGNFTAQSDRPNLGPIGNFIRNFLFYSSVFDQRMFEQFWLGSGADYHMNFDEFWQVITAYQNYGILVERNENQPWDGKILDLLKVNFTPSWPKPFSFSLGNCAIYVQPDGSTDIAAGFFDVYDFDPREAGGRARGFLAEWLVKNADNTFPKSTKKFKIFYP